MRRTIGWKQEPTQAAMVVGHMVGNPAKDIAGRLKKKRDQNEFAICPHYLFWFVFILITP